MTYVLSLSPLYCHFEVTRNIQTLLLMLSLITPYASYCKSEYFSIVPHSKRQKYLNPSIKCACSDPFVIYYFCKCSFVRAQDEKRLLPKTTPNIGKLLMPYCWFYVSHSFFALLIYSSYSIVNIMNVILKSLSKSWIFDWVVIS